jgi:hypothetical protein
MEKFKGLLVMVVVVVATVLAAARLLLAEVHDFWLFLHHLQWSHSGWVYDRNVG